jgi:imidazole glycerol-phosphate synthase subunit HisH
MGPARTVIIDYGSGNLRSAAKAFAHVQSQAGLKGEVLISADPAHVLAADRIVLPGQGAFGDCMGNLQARPGMIAALEEAVLGRGTPFLGICVGMQLLASYGLEHGRRAGLGWIAGEVVPLRPAGPGFKIPHMGWNIVHPALANHGALPRAAHAPGEHYYFVHSFMFECKDPAHVLARCDYGGKFAAIIGRNNILGVQFHPEKSQQAGLKLIENFLRWQPQGDT